MNLDCGRDVVETGSHDLGGIAHLDPPRSRRLILTVSQEIGLTGHRAHVADLGAKVTFTT